MLERTEEALQTLLQQMQVLLGRHNDSSSGGSHGPRRRSETVEGDKWQRRVELPTFSGEDTPGWVGKMEHYFRVRGIREEKIEEVLTAVEGKALSWLQ